MYPLSPKLSILLSHYYRNRPLNRDEFTIGRDKNPPVQYRGQDYSPVVIHFPGSDKKKKNLNATWLNHFIDEWDSRNLPVYPIHDTIHLIQLNNYALSDKYTNPGEYFLKKAGLPYTVAGKQITPADWTHAHKLVLLYECLEQIPSREEPHYFLFFDSSDAILTGDPRRLIEALTAYKCRILFGMDPFIYNSYSWKRNLMHTPRYLKHYITQQCRFINSGTIFGEVRVMKRVLNFLMDSYAVNNRFPHRCDQHYYHEARALFSDEIEVDYHKQYLLNIVHFKSFFEAYQSP